jgi:hypothetical protein
MLTKPLQKSAYQNNIKMPVYSGHRREWLHLYQAPRRKIGRWILAAALSLTALKLTGGF